MRPGFRNLGQPEFQPGEIVVGDGFGHGRGALVLANWVGSAVRTIRIDHLYTEVHNAEAGPSNSAGRTCREGKRDITDIALLRGEGAPGDMQVNA